MFTTTLPKRYLPDKKVHPEILDLTKSIAEELANELLPKVGVATFNYGYARIGMGQDLCRYVRNSVHRTPLIVLSARNIERATKDYGVDYACTIETSLSYGLGLALRDLHGLPLRGGGADAQAEAFAKLWYDSRSVFIGVQSMLAETRTSPV